MRTACFSPSGRSPGFDRRGMLKSPETCQSLAPRVNENIYTRQEIMICEWQNGRPLGGAQLYTWKCPGYAAAPSMPHRTEMTSQKIRTMEEFSAASGISASHSTHKS